MATRLIRAKVRNGVLAGYNTLTESAWSSAGQKIADCVDSTGATTGISIWSVGTWAGSTGSSSVWATQAWWGLDELYWEFAWYCGTNSGASLELRGFPAGKAVTIGVSGYSKSATQQMSFIVNGSSPVAYLNVAAEPPTQPLSFSATADGSGVISITGTKTSSFWYVNGFTASYEDNPLISSIDKLESTGLSTATTSDAAYAANSVDITSDTITKTVSATDIGSGSFTFTPPSWVDGATSLKYGVSNTVIATNGTTPTQSATKTLTLPAALSFVDLTSVSVSSLDKIGSFSPAWKIGTQVVYDPDVGTVYADGTFDDLVFDGVYWVSSGYTGVTQIWDRDPDDKIARVSNVTLNDGGVVPSTGGLTSSGLTSIGLTRVGLTSAGL